MTKLTKKITNLDKELLERIKNGSECLRCGSTYAEFFIASVVEESKDKLICLECFRKEKPDHEALKYYDMPENQPTTIDKEMNETHVEIIKEIRMAIILGGGKQIVTTLNGMIIDNGAGTYQPTIILLMMKRANEVLKKKDLKQKQ